MTRTTTPPQHGERRCYLRGCRQDECAQANYRYMSRLRLDHEHGRQRRCPTDAPVSHLRDLLDAGWTQAQISRASGVSHRVLGHLIQGKYRSTNRSIAHRILGVSLAAPPTDQRDVDGTGSTRRIRALIAIGYTGASIAASAGMHRDALNIIARGERPTVRGTTATTIARLYRTMSRTPGTSGHARAMAIRKGWHGPLAWDETTIDDPAAEPELAEPESDPATKRIDVEHLLRFGVSTGEVMARTGASIAYVRDIAAELRNGKPRDRSRNKTAAAA